MNQDEMMFEYLLQMGAMRPEEVEMMRKQKQIDALRGASMETPQGQMIGKHYVPPSFTQYASQLGQGYMAGKAQKGQDTAMRGMNERQRALLEEMRKRRMGVMTPGAFGMPDTGTGESSVY
jgi:hypothetical protein